MTVTFVRCSDDDRKTYLLFDLPGKFRRPFSVYVDQHRHSGHGRPVRYDTGPYELGRHLVSDNDGGLPPTLGKGIRCSRSTADVLRVLNHPGIVVSSGGLCSNAAAAHRPQGLSRHRPGRHLCILHAAPLGDDRRIPPWSHSRPGRRLDVSRPLIGTGHRRCPDRIHRLALYLSFWQQPWSSFHTFSSILSDKNGMKTGLLSSMLSVPSCPPVPFSAPYTACHPFQTTACSFMPASSFRSSSSFTKGGPFIRSFPFIYFET